MEHRSSEIDHAALLRQAQRLRAEAMVAMWRRLFAALSPFPPKLFPSEF